MADEYVLRVKQPNGEWKFDMDAPMTKREAQRSATVNRCLAGVSSQVWTLKEASEVLTKSE